MWTVGSVSYLIRGPSPTSRDRKVGETLVQDESMA